MLFKKQRNAWIFDFVINAQKERYFIYIKLAMPHKIMCIKTNRLSVYIFVN